MIPNEILNQAGTPITENTPIAFQCQHCGACCRSRLGNPIVLTGYDMYRLAGALGMRSTLNLLKSRIVSVIPNDYGMPVCVLSVTPEGACCLLGGNLCLVHDVKPLVCAMYPLGRIYDATEGTYTYIQPYGNTCAGSGRGTIIAAAQWLSVLKNGVIFPVFLLEAVQISQIIKSFKAYSKLLFLDSVLIFLH